MGVSIPQIITGDSAAGAAQLGYSVKFNARGQYSQQFATEYNTNDGCDLAFTPSSNGNRRTWTYSAWVKFCDKDGSGEVLISGGNGCSSHSDDVRMGLYFDPNGTIVTDLCGIGAFETSYMKLKDFSAWYHIVWQFDTTQPTAANRSIKSLY